MPSASDLGLLSQSLTSLEVGDIIEVNGVFIFNTNKDEIEFVVIPTTKGQRSTSGKAIIGSLRSQTVNSLADLVARALAKKATLTLYVVEHEANNGSGRMVLGLSAYKPRE